MSMILTYITSISFSSTLIITHMFFGLCTCWYLKGRVEGVHVHGSCMCKQRTVNSFIVHWYMHMCFSRYIMLFINLCWLCHTCLLTCIDCVARFLHWFCVNCIAHFMMTCCWCRMLHDLCLKKLNQDRKSVV